MLRTVHGAFAASSLIAIGPADVVSVSVVSVAGPPSGGSPTAGSWPDWSAVNWQSPGVGEPVSLVCYAGAVSDGGKSDPPSESDALSLATQPARVSATAAMTAAVRITFTPSPPG